MLSMCISQKVAINAKNPLPHAPALSSTKSSTWDKTCKVPSAAFQSASPRHYNCFLHPF